MSGFVKSSAYVSAIIKADDVKVDEPWKCTIRQACIYTWNTARSQAEDSTLCERDGKGPTTGYCPVRDLSAIRSFTNDVYEKFQYDSSDCSGDLTHIADFGDLDYLAYCNSIDNDGLDYYSAIVDIANSWSLYSSGQIDDCVENMMLFDPSIDIDSWDSAEFLARSGLLTLFLKL